MSKQNTILKFLVKEKKEEEKEKKISSAQSISQFVEQKINEKTSEHESLDVNDLVTESKSIKDLKIELAAAVEKNKTLLTDLKMSMALIKDASVTNLNKDIQIANLTKQLKKTSLNPESLPELNAKTPDYQSLFRDFNGVFSKEQLKKLRSIPSGKRKDSTFVLACMRFLYPDPNILNDRSVTGRAINKIKKREMTPTKVKIITRILNERLESEKGLDEIEAFQRLDRVKKLIKDAIVKLKPPEPLKPTPVKSEPKDSSEMSTIAQPIALKPPHPTPIVTQSLFPYAYHPFGFSTHRIDHSSMYASLPSDGQMIDWTRISYQLMPGHTNLMPNTTAVCQLQTEPAETKYQNL